MGHTKGARGWAVILLGWIMPVTTLSFVPLKSPSAFLLQRQTRMAGLCARMAAQIPEKNVVQLSGILRGGDHVVARARRARVLKLAYPSRVVFCLQTLLTCRDACYRSAGPERLPGRNHALQPGDLL